MPLKDNIPSDHTPRKVFISADHGLAIVYFLQSDVVPTLLAAGTEVVLLTDDALKTQIQERFGRPGLTVEGLRLDQATEYAKRTHPELQWWLQTLRRVGSSNRINTQAMDSYIDQIAVEEGWKRRLFMPFGRMAIGLLRKSHTSKAVPRQNPDAVYTRYLHGPIQSPPARSGGCQHPRLAYGSIPATRGNSAAHPHRGSCGWMG